MGSWPLLRFTALPPSCESVSNITSSKACMLGNKRILVVTSSQFLGSWASLWSPLKHYLGQNWNGDHSTFLAVSLSLPEARSALQKSRTLHDSWHGCQIKKKFTLFWRKQKGSLGIEIEQWTTHLSFFFDATTHLSGVNHANAKRTYQINNIVGTVERYGILHATCRSSAGCWHLNNYIFILSIKIRLDIYIYAQVRTISCLAIDKHGVHSI